MTPLLIEIEDGGNKKEQVQVTIDKLNSDGKVKDENDNNTVTHIQFLENLRFLN